MRSSRAPLPRWKRATASTGRPRCVARAQEIPRRGAHQRLLQLAAAFPDRVHQCGWSSSCEAALSVARSSAAEFRRRARASSQRGKARHRRQRHEGRELGHLAADLLDHLLDQEIAERDAGEPALAVGDRIEHRGARLVRLDESRGRWRGSARSRRGCRGSSATSTKISGSSTSAGWKKA